MNTKIPRYRAAAALNNEQARGGIRYRLTDNERAGSHNMPHGMDATSPPTFHQP
ncbi:hypothetical protein [Affinibrenneria salicis]|uniref:hypothetical protein n=1 Tax=Affinibrenneria salicis TaxID=2590031 RepID=UPI00168B5DF6|nr:hypothetical protein [Affinibrenneria salicis]